MTDFFINFFHLKVNKKSAAENTVKIFKQSLKQKQLFFFFLQAYYKTCYGFILMNYSGVQWVQILISFNEMQIFLYKFFKVNVLICLCDFQSLTVQMNLGWQTVHLFLGEKTYKLSNQILIFHLQYFTSVCPTQQQKVERACVCAGSRAPAAGLMHVMFRPRGAEMLGINSSFVSSCAAPLSPSPKKPNTQRDFCAQNREFCHIYAIKEKQRRAAEPPRSTNLNIRIPEQQMKRNLFWFHFPPLRSGHGYSAFRVRDAPLCH